MKYKIRYIVGFFQFIFLKVFFYIIKFFVKKEKGCIVGVSEIANMLFRYGKLLDSAKTVCLDANHFYNSKYDYSISKRNNYSYILKRVLYSPLLLGYLSAKYEVFIYFWSTGFLIDREFDFRFLKQQNKKIITIFVGDDVRSPNKLREKLKDLSYDGFLDYVGMVDPFYLSSTYDKYKERVALVSDEYADVCFNCSVDQASYLKSKQYFLPYAYNKMEFFRSDDKFSALKALKILHAPSHPFVKGTPLVRAAVKKLQEEGYLFEYTELMNVPNLKVLEELRSSHIVLNQFYVFVPGVFGIESMANHCAVLMSADPDIETGLPQDASGAWMITKYWQVYDNLKYLLDNPDEIKKYADAGYEFAYNNYTYEKASEYLHKVFKENGIDL